MRSSAKWWGLGLCTLIGAVWAISPWWYFECSLSRVAARCEDGAIKMKVVHGAQCDISKFPNWSDWNGKPMWHVGGIYRWNLRWWQIDHRDVGLILPSLFANRWPAGTQDFCVNEDLLEFVTSGPVAEYVLTIPMWLPFALVGGAVGMKFWRNRRRRLQSHCPRCNYDMTGNQSGKCPECGTPATDSGLPAPKSEPLTEVAGR